MPGLYIITGSNGAGKSSVGANYLPEHIQEKCSVFNGDELFIRRRAELWQQGIKAVKESKRIALEYVDQTFDNLADEAITNNTDFAYEGHFPNEATWNIPRRFKKEGYDIFMIFLGLTHLELSALRVSARAQEGGHYVDPLSLHDNFYGNMEKVNEHHAMLDKLHIIDTSETEHMPVAIFENGRVAESIPCNELPQWFKSYMPVLAEKIKEHTLA